ncbi:MAG: hypothetical protein IIA72_22355 [Proteobacteria bacterium]|nr:hypothetical protein [Pseudomonadota bacterium]
MIFFKEGQHLTPPQLSAENHSTRWIHRSSATPEVSEEGLGGGSEIEAFSGRCVDGPDDVVDVLLAVVGEVGFSWEVASENAVGVLDGAALPG